MNRSEFESLGPGDVVQGLASGDGFIVHANFGDRVVGMRAVDMTNPDEWRLFSKSVAQDAPQLHQAAASAPAPAGPAVGEGANRSTAAPLYASHGFSAIQAQLAEEKYLHANPLVEQQVAQLIPLFAAGHLSADLAAISEAFGIIARRIAADGRSRSFETVAALRKLLEAKDCAVRASLSSRVAAGAVVGRHPGARASDNGGFDPAAGAFSVDASSVDHMGLYIDRVELPRARLKREPYLVCIAASGTTKGPVEVRSQIFKGINRKHALDLDGFEVLAAGDTGGFVAARIVVMESDAGFRQLVGLLEEGLKIARKSAKGQAFLAGFSGVALAGIGVTEALGHVVKVLKKNSDDEMLSFDVQLERRDGQWYLPDDSDPVFRGETLGLNGYREWPGIVQKAAKFVRYGDKVRVHLRFAPSRTSGLGEEIAPTWRAGEQGAQDPNDRRPGVDLLHVFQPGEQGVAERLGLAATGPEVYEGDRPCGAIEGVEYVVVDRDATVGRDGDGWRFWRSGKSAEVSADAELVAVDELDSEVESLDSVDSGGMVDPDDDKEPA